MRLRRCSIRARALAGALVVSSIVLTPGAVGASARTVTVCEEGPPACDFASIQDAVAAVADGDSIRVAPGSYEGDVVVDKSIRVLGSGKEETTLTDAQAAVTIRADERVVIRDLTINGASDTAIVNEGVLVLTDVTLSENGLTDGGPAAGVINHGRATLSGVTIRDSGPGAGFPSVGGIENDGTLTMRDSAVVDNNGGRAGIENAGSALIIRSTFDGNAGMGPANIANSGYLELIESDVAGGVCEVACALANDGTALIVDSLVTGNDGLGSFGGPISNVGGSLTISGTTIRGNQGALGSPGAISNPDGIVTIEDSAITANMSFDGDAAVKNWGTMTIRRSEVSDNPAGGGIENNGTLTLRRSTIELNTNADSFSGGGGVHNLGTLDVRRSRLADNTAAGVGGGLFNEGSAAFKGSVITGNTAVEGQNGTFGGGIYNTGDLTLRHTQVIGNIPDDCFGC